MGTAENSLRGASSSLWIPLLIPAPSFHNSFVFWFFFQIKTEDLSDSLQSAIPPRSGHLVQGSSMMPGSQIAGVSDPGSPRIPNKGLLLTPSPNPFGQWQKEPERMNWESESSSSSSAFPRGLRVDWTRAGMGFAEQGNQPMVRKSLGLEIIGG